MEQRFLGASGVKVSTFALGTMGFGGAATNGWVATIDEAGAREQVRVALDAGVTLFDTANGYQRGVAEELLGRALGADRDRVLVSTKVHVRVGEGPNDVGQSRWHIVRACEDSLRRLGTDHIDLYQVHRPDPLTDIDETLGALSDLVHQGKVRMVGCCTFPPSEIVEAQWVAEQRGHVRFRTNQPPYSIFVRGIERESLGIGGHVHIYGAAGLDVDSVLLGIASTVPDVGQQPCPMYVHRMIHHRLVDDSESDTLAVPQYDRLCFTELAAVDRPEVPLHIARQPHLDDALVCLVRIGVECPEIAIRKDLRSGRRTRIVQ